MAKYYVNTNAQNNGDNEVHKEGCYWLSLCENAKFLGTFDGCKAAVQEAKRLGYVNADGCAKCIRACHTR